MPYRTGTRLRGLPKSTMTGCCNGKGAGVLSSGAMMSDLIMLASRPKNIYRKLTGYQSGSLTETGKDAMSDRRLVIELAREKLTKQLG